MSAAACETWIWGPDIIAKVTSVQNLLMSKEVDPTRNKESQTWLEEINEVIGKSSGIIADKLANLPPNTSP